MVQMKSDLNSTIRTVYLQHLNPAAGRWRKLRCRGLASSSCWNASHEFGHLWSCWPCLVLFILRCMEFVVSETIFSRKKIWYSHTLAVINPGPRSIQDFFRGAGGVHAGAIIHWPRFSQMDPPWTGDSLDCLSLRSGDWRTARYDLCHRRCGNSWVAHQEGWNGGAIATWRTYLLPLPGDITRLHNYAVRQYT